ncbi:hypothetical protein F7725_004670 [Dissostichus mawsoni]|uniref:Uncharacterized protein n=1 Tax=Dissostichus mawsoni TaxID=36200 RepID=A0A7J5XJF0_DISMA|nr:hypothetical protein F7725_004670 [Dissostichus mawsoni]
MPGYESFCSAPTPFSSYSALLSQKDSLSFMMLASTAPPRNTMCLRRGGSSMRILNFYTVSPSSTLSRYSCFISLSSLDGSPGYMVVPPERTIKNNQDVKKQHVLFVYKPFLCCVGALVRGGRPEVDVCSLDGVEQQLGHPRSLHVDEALLLLDVVSHVAQLLLHHAHSLKVGGVVEGVTAKKQELMAGKGLSISWLTLMRYRVMSRPAMSSLRVRWGKEKPSYTGQMWVTPSPESRTTPSEHSLNCHIKALEPVLLKHDLSNFLSVLGGAGGTEGVVPQVEHVLPGAHHTVLHGVADLQHGAALAGLITHHQVLLLKEFLSN